MRGERMFRPHMLILALLLTAASALSGCARTAPPPSPCGSGYYDDYPSYRQSQWDRYYCERAYMLEGERLAAQTERLRLERERLAWETREMERLNREQELRAQWEQEKARREQQRQEPAYRDQLYEEYEDQGGQDRPRHARHVHKQPRSEQRRPK